MQIETLNGNMEAGEGKKSCLISWTWIGWIFGKSWMDFSVNKNYVIVNVPLNLYYSFNGTIDLLVCNSPGDFNQILMFLVIWTKLLVLLSITVVLYLVWLRCSVLIIILFMNTILKFSFIKKAYICYFDGSVLPKNFSFAFYDCSHQSMIRFVLVQ